jgi:hypothetical protein
MFLALLFLLAPFVAVGAAEEQNRRQEEKEETETFSRYLSGYDWQKNVFWELEQKYKISK